MQIFLPYAEFDRSVRCLDPDRLGNQVYRECLTLIRGGWPHHRVSKMWANHRHAMAQYAVRGLIELARRGRIYAHHYVTFVRYMEQFPDTGLPPFVGDERLHASHRAALLHKNFQWYAQFGWSEAPEMRQYWPEL